MGCFHGCVVEKVSGHTGLIRIVAEYDRVILLND